MRGGLGTGVGFVPVLLVLLIVWLVFTAYVLKYKRIGKRKIKYFLIPAEIVKVQKIQNLLLTITLV